MKLVQLERDALLKPLQAVTGIVEKRHTLPILSNVLIERKQGRLSLVATDLVFNVGRGEDLWTKLTLGGVLGATGGVRMSRTIKYTVRDRALFRASVDRALGWEFSRVTVTHGDIIENDAKDSLSCAAAWLRD